MATLNPKTNFLGLNRSEFHQKHKYYITKPNQAETAAKYKKKVLLMTKLIVTEDWISHETFCLTAK